MKLISINMKQFHKKFKVYSDTIHIYESILNTNGKFYTFKHDVYVNILTDFNIFFTCK